MSDEQLQRDYEGALQRINELKESLVAAQRKDFRLQKDLDASHKSELTLRSQFEQLARMAGAVGQQNDLLKAQAQVLQDRIGATLDLFADWQDPGGHYLKVINMLKFGQETDPADAQAMLESGKTIDVESKLIGQPLTVVGREDQPATIIEIATEMPRVSRQDPKDPFKLV